MQLPDVGVDLVALIARCVGELEDVLALAIHSSILNAGVRRWLLAQNTIVWQVRSCRVDYNDQVVKVLRNLPGKPTIVIEQSNGRAHSFVYQISQEHRRDLKYFRLPGLRMQTSKGLRAHAALLLTNPHNWYRATLDDVAPDPHFEEVPHINPVPPDAPALSSQDYKLDLNGCLINDAGLRVVIKGLRAEPQRRVVSLSLRACNLLAVTAISFDRFRTSSSSTSNGRPTIDPRCSRVAKSRSSLPCWCDATAGARR